MQIVFKYLCQHKIRGNISGEFLFTLRVLPEICCERKSPKKYFSYFVLMSGLELEPWLLTNTLPTRPRRLQPIYNL